MYLNELRAVTEFDRRNLKYLNDLRAVRSLIRDNCKEFEWVE